MPDTVPTNEAPTNDLPTNDALTTDAPARVEVQPGTVVVYADIACAFAHLCVHRLHEARRIAGLEGVVTFDLRPLPLEVLQASPLSLAHTERTVAGIAPLAPSAGWQAWTRRHSEWSPTSLLALEAVESARRQGTSAHEELDRALRIALFRDNACIGVVNEVLDVAARCPSVDAHAIELDLRDGRARAAVYDRFEQARPVLQGSPHCFLADGTEMFNPGLEVEWLGGPERGFLRIRNDQPEVVEQLVRRAGVTGA